MRLVGLLVALAALAPAATGDETHPVDGAQAAAHAAEEAGHGSREGDASLFVELFKHLEPHAVAGVWWGGSKGFGLVSPYPADAEGRPLEGTPDHPVGFHDPEEFREHYRASLGGGNGILIYNINTAMWIACVLLLALFVPVARRARALSGKAPRGAGYGLAEVLVLYVRDEMVYATMGKENGRRFVPLFLTIFFFLLFMNLLGLAPFFGPFGGTATANLAVTAAMALVAFVWIHLAGIREHGFFKHLANFLPHGLPWWVVPVIAVVELVGILVKPFALTIRLTANMNAGHLLLLALFGMVYYFNSYAVAPVVMGVASAIFALEVFVAFVQAYIFTYLSIIFVGATVHPDH